MALAKGYLRQTTDFVRNAAVRLLAVAVTISAISLVEHHAWAQDKPAQAQDVLLGSAELQALVAPIALYPDPLLAEVLMASTYPLEVVQADRWLKQNERLQGDALKAAADKAGWDQSVASLVATPDVLVMMSSKLEWTQKLGDAVLAQQQDVMDAVQALRGKASANDKLTSTKEQKVVVNNDNGKQVIAIEPAAPDTVYVPYYDPAVVYGAWPYSDYPAYYFPAPAYIPGAILSTGLAFGAGYALGRWASGGNYWGGGINWNNNNININRPQVNPLNGGNWSHNPAHRGSVKYGNSSVQQRFGGSNARPSVQNRAGSAARGGQKALAPKAGQAGRTPTNANRSARPANRSTNASGRPGATQGAKQKAAKGHAATKPKAKSGSANRAAAAHRSAGASQARAQSQRGRNSMASARTGAAPRAHHAARGGGGRGGGRRSDIRLKHDIVLLGYARNGVGIYRFTYNGGHTEYVGVLAQQVRDAVPSAVTRGRDGYLRVRYSDVGVRFETYRHWISSGAQRQRNADCWRIGCGAVRSGP